MVVPVRERTRARPVRLRVRVAPGARRTRVVGRLGESWKLQVHAPPERGRANDEVTDLLAHILEVPRSAVRVVAGHASRSKVVEVGRTTQAEAERLLRAASEVAS